jgi:uncharacterized protein (TIGR03546 family)
MLPTPIAWVKKILRILKSNLSPNQIAFSFALGVFAGLPPMGLHVIIPCTLALLVRCSFRAFLISMGLFKLVSLAVAPGAYAIGQWCLDASRGLDAFWRWLFHLPFLAPMGYGRYFLFGSLVLSVGIAVPVFLLARYLVIRYRDSFTGWVAGWRVSGVLRGRRGVGFVRWLLVGGEAKYETKAPPRGPFRFIRREMLIGVPIVYALCYLFAAFLVPLFAGTLATSTASWVIGSEVAAEHSSFNLFTGELVLDGLIIQDPHTPDENLVEIPSLTLDAGMVPLLAKRVVFNRVVIADVSLHVKREVDGTLNVDNATSGWNVDGYLEWAAEHARQVDWLGLLRRFLQYLEEARPLAPRGDPYAAYRGGRSFPAFRPPFAIERVEIGRVLITLEDDFEGDAAGPLPPITLVEVELTNLAFPADLRSGPILARLHGQWGDDPESGFELAMRFGASGRSIEASVTRLDLPRLASFYATTLPVTVDSGRLSLTARVEQRDDVSTGDVSFLLEELHLSGDPARPLFGLPAETSARVIDGINRYAEELPIVFGSTVSGSADAATLEWEAPLLGIAREGLLMFGRRELESTIADLGVHIDGLGGLADIPIDAEYAEVQAQVEVAARGLIEEAAGDLVDDLLGPLAPTEDERPELPIVDLLERLLSPGDPTNGDDPETEQE